MQRLDYDEYGNVTYNSNPDFTPFTYAGGLYDAQTKLVRFGARDYDAETGRWITKDPIGFRGGVANLYEYCEGNSIGLTDPYGRVSIGSVVAMGVSIYESIHSLIDISASASANDMKGVTLGLVNHVAALSTFALSSVKTFASLFGKETRLEDDLLSTMVKGIGADPSTISLTGAFVGGIGMAFTARIVGKPYISTALMTYYLTTTTVSAVTAYIRDYYERYQRYK